MDQHTLMEGTQMKDEGEEKENQMERKMLTRE